MNEEYGIELLDQILNAINNPEDVEQFGENVLSSLIAMDEDKFQTIKPILIDNISQSFNSAEYKLAICQMLNTQGLKLEDVEEVGINAIETIDSIDEEKMSANKKDFFKEVFTIFVNSVQESNGISKRIINIPIELCREGAKLPTYATTGSAAMDVYSPEDFSVAPGETKIIPLGIKLNIPRGYAVLIQPRSGLSAKTKLRIANTPGLIDSDFHEEICVIFENISSHLKNSTMTEEGIMCSPLYGSTYSIDKGERCCQIRLIEVPQITWTQVENLGNFEENHGAGFGSTGIK